MRPLVHIVYQNSRTKRACRIWKQLLRKPNGSRLLCHWPLLIKRQWIQPLREYDNAKGIILLANLWSLHHEPDVWEAPNDHRPQRFLDEEGNFIPPKAGIFLPFTGGLRICVGKPLARIEFFLVLARLLHSFKFENPPGYDLPTLEPISSIALMPQPFRGCASKRHAV